MKIKNKLSNIFIGFAFLFPYFILWATFNICPIIYGFYISLHDWQPLLDSEYIGFKNYNSLYKTNRFWISLQNTFIYSIIVIPLIIILGLSFALMLHKQKIKGKVFIESSFFFPYLLNVSIVSIVWVFLLDPDVGLINLYLKKIGLNPPTFLNDSFWVIPTIAFVTAWWLSGYRMIIFRAALNSIPTDIYENAKLEGANYFQILYHITLPLIKPAMLFAIVMTLVGGLRTFGQVIIMTAGGPGLSSEVLALYMYRLAFEFLNFGQAAAVGFILFFIMAILSLIVFKILGFESELR